MAKIRASVRNQPGSHQVMLQTGSNQHTLEIPPKADGNGSSVNGGELLFLALATCYCNDLYREAGKRGIRVRQVEVSVEGSFEQEGGPGSDIRYSVRVQADAAPEAIRELVWHTDRVVEIHNTLRTGSTVPLIEVEITE